MIYHTSDWHLDHDNIIRFDKRPDDSVGAMNARIIATTNECVGENDWLMYHGDMLMNKQIDRDDIPAYIGRLKHFLVQLRCQNIIMVGGNHDRVYTKRYGEYLPNWAFWKLFQTRYECLDCNTLWSPTKTFGFPKKCKCKYRDTVYASQNIPIYDIHPMGYELRITKKICAEQGIPIVHDGTLVVCTHYSHRVWNKSHHAGKDEKVGKAINLYGHSHGGLPGIKNSFDVGFNVWNHPLSLVEILTKLMPEHNQSEAGKTYFGHHNGERDY